MTGAGAVWRSTVGSLLGLALFWYVGRPLAGGGAQAAQAFVGCCFIGWALPSPRRWLAKHAPEAPAKTWLVASVFVVFATFVVSMAWGALIMPSVHWEGAVSDVRAHPLVSALVLDQPAFAVGDFAGGRSDPQVQPFTIAMLERTAGAGHLLFPWLLVCLAGLAGLAAHRAHSPAWLPWLTALACASAPLLTEPASATADSGLGGLFSATCIAAVTLGLARGLPVVLAVGVLLAIASEPQGLVVAALTVAITFVLGSRAQLLAAVAAAAVGAAARLPVQACLPQETPAPGDAVALLVLAAVLLLTADAWMRWRGLRIRVRAVLAVGVASAALVSAPSLPIEALAPHAAFDPDVAERGLLAANLTHVPVILAALVEHALVCLSFGATFVLPLLMLLAWWAVRHPGRAAAQRRVLAWRATFASPGSSSAVATLPQPVVATLWFVLLGLAAGATPLLGSAEADLDQHLRTNMGSVLLHWVGAAWVLSACLLHELLGRRRASIGPLATGAAFDVGAAPELPVPAAGPPSREPGSSAPCSGGLEDRSSWVDFASRRSLDPSEVSAPCAHPRGLLPVACASERPTGVDADQRVAPAASARSRRRGRWAWMASLAWAKLREGPAPWARAIRRGVFQLLPPFVQRGALVARYPRHFAARARRPEPPSAAGAETAALVSVVMPVYEQADLLGAAVTSVLEQTWSNLELIVVDDGSGPEVAAVLDRFGHDPRLVRVRQDNHGLPAALDTGFAAARGEFWCWTSADNLMHPRQLERLVACLRADPRAAMVYADYDLIDAAGDPVRGTDFRVAFRRGPEDAHVRLPQDTSALALVHDNFVGPCFCFRGAAARLLGGHRGEQGLEDYDYWLRLDGVFSVRHLGRTEPLYRYRVHGGSLTARARELDLQRRARALLNHERARAAWRASPLRVVALAGTRDWVAACVRRGDVVVDAAAPAHEPPRKTLVVARASELGGSRLPPLPAHAAAAVWFAAAADVWRAHAVLGHERVAAFASDAAIAARLALFTPRVFVGAEDARTMAWARAFAGERTSPRGDESGAPAPRARAPRARPLRVLLVADADDGLSTAFVRELAEALSAHDVEPVVDVPRVDVHGAGQGRVCDLVFACGTPVPADRAVAARVPFVQGFVHDGPWCDPVCAGAWRAAADATTAFLVPSVDVLAAADRTHALAIDRTIVLPGALDDVAHPAHADVVKGGQGRGLRAGTLAEDRRRLGPRVQVLGAACADVFAWIAQGGAPSAARAWVWRAERAFGRAGARDADNR